MVPGWNSAEVKGAAPQQAPPALPAGAGGVATLPAVRPGTADPGLVCNTTAGPPTAQQPAMPGSAGKSDGSNLFDALLLAASGGGPLFSPFTAGGGHCCNLPWPLLSLSCPSTGSNATEAWIVSPAAVHC